MNICIYVCIYVRSTAASELILPIKAYLPLEALSALPVPCPRVLCLHADSLSANKLVIQHIADYLPRVPVVDALCFGQLDFCFFVVLRSFASV